MGWLLARQESATLAKVLILQSCERQHIGPDQLISRCRPQAVDETSQPVALLLAILGVVPPPRTLGPTSPPEGLEGRLAHRWALAINDSCWATLGQENPRVVLSSEL